MRGMVHGQPGLVSRSFDDDVGRLGADDGTFVMVYQPLMSIAMAAMLTVTKVTILMIIAYETAGHMQ
jgi:hypothetical protein